MLDPFAGSNITGEVCERLQRHWLAFELLEEYLEGSKFRFPEVYRQGYMFNQQLLESVEPPAFDENLVEQPRLLDAPVEYRSQPDRDTDGAL